MPQLDATYFISQIFWLAILFGLFYFSIRSFVIPKLQMIIRDRAHLKEESDSFVGIVDLELTQLRIEAKKRSEDANELIKKMESNADSKFDTYSKNSLLNSQKKLDQALDEANKEIIELTKQTLADDKMNDLVVASAKNMIFKIVNIDVPTSELKNFIKS